MPVITPYFPPQLPQATLTSQQAMPQARQAQISPFTISLKPLHQGPQATEPKAYLGFQDLQSVAPADVLVVLAHPDDEIFLSGTVASLAKAGKKVQFIYVTNGKAGEDVTGQGRTGDILGEARSYEAARAVQALQVDRKPLILDFMDGKTGEYPEALKEQLRAILLHTRPKSVLLFNADNGLTGHPDHKNVSRFIDDVLDTLAVGKTQRDQQDRGQIAELLKSSAIYQASLSETAYRHFRQFFPESNASWQGVQPSPDNAIQLRTQIPSDIASLKAASHRQHQSQYPEDDFRSLSGFYQQYPYEEFIKYQIQSQPKPQAAPKP